MDTPERLMRRALAHLEGLGLDTSEWTLGGGTLLMLRYQHRHSRDIDIFIHDVQMLSYLSPRLNDATAAGVLGYSETGNVLRLEYPEGELDFLVVAPVFPDLEPELIEMAGIPGSIPAMPDLEILAQKLHYRASGFKGRDLYDFAAVAHFNPAVLETEALREVALNRRDALEAALASPMCREGYAAVDRPSLGVSFEEARDLLLGWLDNPAPALRWDGPSGPG